MNLSTICLNHLCNVGDSDYRDEKRNTSVDGNVGIWIGIWNVYGCHVSCDTKKMSVRDVMKLRVKFCGSRSVIWNVYVSVCLVYRMSHCLSRQMLGGILIGRVSVPCKIASIDLWRLYRR